MVRLKTTLLALALAASAPAAAFDLGSLGGLLQGGGSGGGGSDLDLGRLIDSASKVVTGITPEQEATIGTEAAAVLVGAMGLVNDKEVQRYVNRVGMWVALQSERPELPWRFGVLDDGMVNSFAAPGGYVFITRGMLANLRNEAELAGVLAHEIVHVVEKHYLEGVQSNAGVDLAATLVAASMKKDRSLVDRVGNAAREMYARGLDKSDEYEADAKAMVLAARAGYDPYGLPSALQTLGSLRADDDALSYLFATHPPLDDRLGHMEATTTRVERYADQPLLPDRFLRSAAIRR